MLGSKGLDLVTMMLLLGGMPDEVKKEIDAEFDKIYKEHIQEQKQKQEDKKARVADVKEKIKQEDKEKVVKEENVVKELTLEEHTVMHSHDQKEIESLKKKLEEANKRVARRDAKIQELEGKNANIKCSLADLLVQM